MYWENHDKNSRKNTLNSSREPWQNDRRTTPKIAEESRQKKQENYAKTTRWIYQENHDKITEEPRQEKQENHAKYIKRKQRQK